jgi:hypothetical protein
MDEPSNISCFQILATNQLSGGSFSVIATNAVSFGTPQQFYALKVQ